MGVASEVLAAILMDLAGWWADLGGGLRVGIVRIRIYGIRGFAGLETAVV